MDIQNLISDLFPTDEAKEIAYTHLRGKDHLPASIVDFLFSDEGLEHNKFYEFTQFQKYFSAHSQYAPLAQEISRRYNKLKQHVEKLYTNIEHDIMLALHLQERNNDTLSDKMSIAQVSTLETDADDEIYKSHPFKDILAIAFRQIQGDFQARFPFLYIHDQQIKLGAIIKKHNDLSTLLKARAYGKISKRKKHKKDLDKFIQSLKEYIPGKPLIAYQHGDFIFDVKEWNGKRGIPLWMQNSHSARCMYTIKNKKLKEIKGGFVSLPKELLVGASYAPPGCCSLAAVYTEEKVVSMLSDVLPFKASAYDLDISIKTCGIEDPEKKIDYRLGMLIREGNIADFAPHMRMVKFKSQIFAELLAENGFDFVQSFFTLGEQLGSAHRMKVYPLYLCSGNIDMFGNMIDLEGTMYEEHFMKMYPLWCQAALGSDNPQIKSQHIKYTKHDGKVYQSNRFISIPSIKSWKDLDCHLKTYGVEAYKFDSFALTSYLVLRLCFELNDVPCMKKLAPKCYAAYLDGYIQAFPNAFPEKIMKSARRIRPNCSINPPYKALLHPIKLLQMGGLYKSLSSTYTHVLLPRDFRFVDQENTDQ